jgi:hypothetical protein
MGKLKEADAIQKSVQKTMRALKSDELKKISMVTLRKLVNPLVRLPEACKELHWAQVYSRMG